MKSNRAPPGFELIGKRVFDDSEEGELFVGTVPELSHASRVVWARVGEEETRGWKGRNFKPSERALAEVLNGRQGRFFVRVYDEKGAMLDGGQFRYLRGLGEIRVNGEPYAEYTLLVPSSTGHPPTTVRFIGAAGEPVHATLPPGAVSVEDGTGGLIAEPHPDADELSCALEADGGHVVIALRLPRIWWRMEREGAESDGEWSSTPLQMTRHEFRERADSHAALRLRPPKRITSAFVGFDDEPDVKYTKRDDEVVLPLAPLRRLFADRPSPDQGCPVQPSIASVQRRARSGAADVDPDPRRPAAGSGLAHVCTGYHLRRREVNAVLVDPQR